MHKIKYVDLQKQWSAERKALLKEIDNVVSEGMHVNGSQISKFEKNISKLLNIKYCVSLNSGTDALVMSLHVLGVKRGDEVITVSNSFIASTASIIHLGAKPVFVDINEDLNINQNAIESKITSKTKAIMPVHLTGRCCNMEKIVRLSKKYNIPVIEDSAQSIGSKYNNKFAGTFGQIGCFSTHPLKNLNALGDGGFIVTNSSKIYNKISLLRNHGLKNRNNAEHFGYVSRMDTIQATILNYRLKNLNKVIKARRRNALLYFKLLKGLPIIMPLEKKMEFNTYHTFIIICNNRNKLKKFLLREGIETAIHYPIPIHLQKAYLKFNLKKLKIPNTEKLCKKILTLPINQYLNTKDINYISKKNTRVL